MLKKLENLLSNVKSNVIRYRLTSAADADLENILDYGVDEFGLEPALDYYDKLTQRFSSLVEQPYLYQSIDHIKEGFRRSVFGVHSIYYRIAAEEIIIVRILRSQDSEALLSS